MIDLLMKRKEFDWRMNVNEYPDFVLITADANQGGACDTAITAGCKLNGQNIVSERSIFFLFQILLHNRIRDLRYRFFRYVEPNFCDVLRSVFGHESLYSDRTVEKIFARFLVCSSQIVFEILSASYGRWNLFQLWIPSENP